MASHRRCSREHFAAPPVLGAYVGPVIGLGAECRPSRGVALTRQHCLLERGEGVG